MNKSSHFADFYQSQVESFDLNGEDQLLFDFIQLCGDEKFVPEAASPIAHFSQFQEIISKQQKQEKIKIVTIAGTNGKGQCSYQLTDLLLRKNLRVATWTSPHIHSLRERLLYNGEMISHQEFNQSKRAFIDQYGARAFSFYETLFWIFCHWIIELKKLQVDVIILEVGLGGRLDAVNYFNADIVGLTSIGRDHQEFLGERLEDILKEKWGVARKEQTLISALEQTFLRECSEDLTPRPKICLDLFGQQILERSMTFEKRNLTLSLALNDVVLHGDFSASRALRNISFYQQNPLFYGPARMQEMTRGDMRFIFIGAHNHDGFRHMAKMLAAQQKKWPISQVVLSFSQRKDREISSCLETLLKSPCLGEKLWLTSFDHPRAASAEQLEKVCKQQKAKERLFVFKRDWSRQELDQLSTIQSSLSPPQGYILVCGSYYFISHFQRLLLSR